MKLRNTNLITSYSAIVEIAIMAKPFIPSRLLVYLDL